MMLGKLMQEPTPQSTFLHLTTVGLSKHPMSTGKRIRHTILLDKEVMHIRDMLIPKFSEIIYNGLWYSPEMDFIMSAFNKSQEAINGKVTVALYKGNVTVVGRESPTSLYDQDFSSMEVEGGFDAEDSRGFINIHAIRLKAHNLVLHNRRPYNWREE